MSAPKVTVLREIELVTLTPAIRAERGIASAPQGALVYAGHASASRRDRPAAGRRHPPDQPHAVIRSADDVTRALDYYAGRRYDSRSLRAARHAVSPPTSSSDERAHDPATLLRRWPSATPRARCSSSGRRRRGTGSGAGSGSPSPRPNGARRADSRRGARADARPPRRHRLRRRRRVREASSATT